MRLLIGIFVFLAWSAGSGYWYVCKIKGMCKGSELALSGELQKPLGVSTETASPDSTSPNQAEVLASMEMEAGATEQHSDRENASADFVSPSSDPIAIPPSALQEKQTLLFSFAKPLLQNRADITDYIDEVSAFLKTNSAYRIAITGYTDDTAARENNLRLGQKRAEVVADMLRKNGVSEAQLLVSSRGEQDPVATNDTRAGRQRNRRVEVKLLIPESP